MREPIARISISVPSDLLTRFDDHITRLGYGSRSKALQDAMQILITESKWLCKEMGTGIGAVALVYDYGVKGLEKELKDVQHRHRAIIPSTMHIHLDDDNGLEIVAVKGDAWDVRDLAQELRTKKGVRALKLAIITP